MNTSFDEAFTDWLFCERVHINQVLHYWFAVTPYLLFGELPYVINCSQKVRTLFSIQYIC